MKNIWKSLGVRKDDTILVQSNIVYLLKTYKCSVKDILESLLEVAGTVVFPTFNVDSVMGNSFGEFDIRSTPSRMGVLSEYARVYCNNSIRSGHPMYSFVSVGQNSAFFNVNNFSGYGKDSPFAILRRLNGKILIIGSLKNSEGNSILHHVEEIHQVPYRFYKLFSGKYTDRYGEITDRTYTFYCNGGVKTLLDPIDDLLWEAGLYKGCKPYFQHGCRVINANDIFKFVWNLIEQGKAKGLLYETI
jgi:aminoglycoside 3-N-acetyltransferase